MADDLSTPNPESRAAAPETTSPATTVLISTLRNKVKRSKSYVLVLGLFVVLVGLLNLPLVLHLDTHVIGRPFEDVFEVLWQLSWMDTAVFERGANPFYNPDVFYPQGWHLASGAQPSWFLLLLAPATHLLGPTTTYNVVQLLTIAFAAFGVFLLASSQTTNRAAAFIAGVAYISAPVLTIRLGGHLHTLISALFLPYAVLCVYRSLTAQNHRWIWIVLSAVTLSLTILGHWYFLFIATLPLIGFFFFVPSSISFWQRLAIGLAIAAITLILVAPFAYLAWDARDHMYPDGQQYSVDHIDSFGLSPDYLLAGNPNHPLWGELSSTLFPLRGEQDAVAIGFAALAMAVVGMITKPWWQTRPFAIMAAIALVLAMGLSLYWRAEPVHLPVGSAIEQIYDRLFPSGPTSPPGTISIPLLGRFLHRFVPLMSSMRVWSRFAIPLMLAIAVVAGLGMGYLLQQSKLTRWTAIALGFFLVFEGLIIPYREFTEVATNHRTLDDWLAEQPPGTTLIEYPFPGVSKNAMYSQSLHGQTIVNGYTSLEPSFLSEVRDQLGPWPDEEAASLLRHWAVRYMVLNGSSANADLQERILPATQALPGVCLVGKFTDGFMNFDRAYLFEILPVADTCE